MPRVPRGVMKKTTHSAFFSRSAPRPLPVLPLSAVTHPVLVFMNKEKLISNEYEYCFPKLLIRISNSQLHYSTN